MTDSCRYAPRFWAYFCKLEGRPMFLMLRSVWAQMKARSDQAVPIDIRLTPMARLAANAEVLAAVAERKSDYEAAISIFRSDPKDARPVNVDRYRVWERVPDHRDFLAMVNEATTDNDDNMRSFLDEHVFLLKDEPGPDHWLEEVPVAIRAIVNLRRSEG